MASRRALTECCAAIALSLLLVALSGQAGRAQNSLAPAPDLKAAPAPDQKGCAERLRPDSDTASPKLNDPPGEQLSQKLDRSEGVICPPPGVDPEIASPPPGGGKTPVIPPPGSPGGDQSIRPKSP
jgi:hypothetical protein